MDSARGRTYEAETTAQLGSRETIIVQAEIHAPRASYSLQARAEYPPQ